MIFRAMSIVFLCQLQAICLAQYVNVSPVSWTAGIVDLTISKPSDEEGRYLRQIAKYSQNVKVRSLVIDSPGELSSVIQELKFASVFHLTVSELDSKKVEAWLSEKAYREHLKSITLTDARLDRLWIAAISTLKACESVEFITVETSGVDFSPLANMVALKSLKLFFASVANDQISQIAKCPGITILRICGRSIDDDCLNDVLKMTNLQVFMFDDTSITENGIDMVRSRLPALRILSAY